MNRPLRLATAILILLSPCARAELGNEGGHGGDPYALEFTTLADYLGKAMPAYEARNPALFTKWKFTPAQFEHAVETVRVVSAEGDQVVLRGREVDAINLPAQDQILVNRARWREDDLHSRMQLALHEYFGILGVEQDAYGASEDFAGFVADEAGALQASAPSDSFMGNLFYGHCISVPAVVDTTICDGSSPQLAQAESCAQEQAEGMCRASGKAQCDLVSSTETPVLSQQTIGLRYCEVLVILR